MERDPYRQPQVITHSDLIPAAAAAVMKFSGMLIRNKHLPWIGSEDLHCLDPKRSFATVLWMKQLFIAVLVAITATLAPAIWPEKNPAVAVRSFYSWYVSEVASGARPLEKERELMRKFVTDRLLNQIDKMPKGPGGLDGDFFLNAQEIDPEWGKNIAVGNTYIGKTTSKLSVILTGRKVGDRQFEVKMLFQEGAWKIDEVKFSE